MTTLVLLHGAWHGGWCWAPLQEELTALGVEAVAVDLPIDEPSAGVERYAEVVHQAIAGRERVVIVAHSLSGLVAPVVAERVDARGIVMLAALWPEPGRSPREQARQVPDIYTQGYRLAHLVRHADGSTAMTNEGALDLLYHDCDPAVALAACARLRPQHWRMWAEPSPLAAWPRIPVAGFACRSDRMLGGEGMRRGAARQSASLAWLDSGHSPMLSVPAELARVLVKAVGELARPH